jgi:hypothetical protein
MEFKNHIYIENSGHAYDLCTGRHESGGWLSALLPPAKGLREVKHLRISHDITEDFLVRKKRHTIVKRDFHFVTCGTVDHLKRPDLYDLKNKISKVFSMHQTLHHILLGLLSDRAITVLPVSSWIRGSVD